MSGTMSNSMFGASREIMVYNISNPVMQHDSVYQDALFAWWITTTSVLLTTLWSLAVFVSAVATVVQSVVHQLKSRSDSAVEELAEVSNPSDPIDIDQSDGDDSPNTPCQVEDLSIDESTESKRLSNTGADRRPQTLKDESHSQAASVEEQRIINDVIHGNIELSKLLWSIIDTKHFQRLRNIKCLAGTYFVFPGAAHNWFEHLIGVAYLAGKLLKHLKKKQPEINISETDIVCVQIAGLCRGLGIGPFGRLFPTMFMNPFFSKWKHVKMSIAMFDNLITAEGFHQVFADHHLRSQDVDFIRELITGVDVDDEKAVRNLKGRGPDKRFLYQILGDRGSCFNVEAWDSYVRDAFHLDIRSSFDHKRLVMFIQVRTDPETRETRLSLRDKEIDSLYNEWTTRIMHGRNAKYHKIAIVVEKMIAEALRLANDFIKITGTDDKRYRMSEAVVDVKALLKMDDSIYHKILHSRDPNLRESRQILEDIESRRLYRFIGQATVLQGMKTRKNVIENEASRLFKEQHNNLGICAVISTFDYGFKKNDPLEKVLLYSKGGRSLERRASRSEDGLLRPGVWREHVVRFYSISRDPQVVDAATKCLDSVCRELKLKRKTPAQQPVRDNDFEQTRCMCTETRLKTAE